MPDINLIYSILALLMGFVCFIVALSLTLYRTGYFIDVSFTVREWLLSALFIAQFIASYGPPDKSVDLFHAAANELRVAFMLMLFVSAVISAGALLYNFIWRIRNNKRSLLTEDKDD